MRYFLIFLIFLSNHANAVFFDRPDYFANKALYDEVDDIIELLYDQEISEKDRFLRLMVKDPVLVKSFQDLKTENEAKIAKFMRQQGLTDEQIEERFKHRLVVDAFKFTMENDFISGTDREYTNGLRTEVSFNDPAFEKFFQDLGYSHADLYAICGQEIYTNSNPSAETNSKVEPPKAGVLYCGAAATAYKMDAARARLRMMDRFEMRMGTVGEGSFAEQIQNSFHRLIDNKVANWSEQLRSTSYLSISFERNLKVAEGSVWGDSQPEYNIIVSGTGTVGTFSSYVGGEVVINFRLIGSLVDMYMGRNSPRSNLETLRAMSLESRLKKTICERDWGVNLFVAGGARYVFHNRRFDAPQQGYQTDHVPLVFNMRTGVVAHYKSAMFEFSLVKNTPQWSSTNGSDNDIFHSYGSASFTLTGEFVRDSLRWMFDKEYRDAIRAKRQLRNLLRQEGVKVVYQAATSDTVEKSFTLKCN